ncbi:MAG: hypothetical protein COW54_12225 [Rhodobacteraceae bacterium CG17_big_fil_post_rev_8_21_14_2_50_63_15]|nr:hypothetical protein [Roseovarius sp.]PIV77913.1 MAG: hypothetical protein COW54_12225 [Rhodobacteraceae bacterium CG17_big_fil_post_rev_8_21_14_2_50_63_15]
MGVTASLSRPGLTLPEAEAACLREAYGQARAILEYGSGGSTVMAAEMPGKRVWSVESDADWATMMRGWFEANPPVHDTQVEIVWCDIGPTKAWGHPRDKSGWQRYARYPLGIWERADVTPDLVLVDGRFRTGCALAAAFHAKAPLRLMFDDYVPRHHYHAVEDFIGAPRRVVGRMAEFVVSPMPVPAERLLTIIEMMTRP